MTRETCELLSQDIMQTGRIPLGNSSGRPAIPPKKQILAFLWTMTNQEPAQAVAGRFDITISSINRVLCRVTQATPIYTTQYFLFGSAQLLGSFHLLGLGVGGCSFRKLPRGSVP